MGWLKHVIVDILVTLGIIAAAVLDPLWLRWVVLAYTGLMLVLKGVAYFGSTGATGRRFQTPDVPAWFFHLLYAINVLAALAAWRWQTLPWILIATGWLLIWLLSVLAEHRTRQVMTERKRKQDEQLKRR